MMNPSNNDCNYKSFINNDVCFGSELDDPFSFSFHVPSPYMHYEDEAVLLQDFHNLQMQQHQLTEENGVDSSKKYSVNYSKAEGCSKKCNSKAEEVPRKKCYKKDRHSKINTAHGPRDRRMRLSVSIAQEFFGLQDMLGFATASHTVGWLLLNYHSAIVEFSKGLPQTNTSSTSECEAISAITKNQQECPKEKRSYTKEKKKVRRFNPNSKQLREKARERARERTKEKILRVNEEKLHSSEGHNPQELRSLSPYKTTGEDSGTQDYINSYSYEMLREVEELSCHERQLPGTYQENIVNESMVAGGSWSQSEPFNFHLNEIYSGPQFGDVQFYWNSSEAFGTTNL